METLGVLSSITLLKSIAYILYEYLLEFSSSYTTVYQHKLNGFHFTNYVNPLRNMYPLFHSGRTYIELLRESHFINSISLKNTNYVLDSIQLHPLVLKPLNFYLFGTPFSYTVKYFIIIALIDLITAISFKYLMHNAQYLDNSWQFDIEYPDKFAIYYLLNPISIISNFCLSMDNLNYMLIVLALLVITHDTTVYEFKALKQKLGDGNKFIIDIGIDICHNCIFFTLLGFIYQINSINHICTVFALGFIMYRYRIDTIVYDVAKSRRNYIRITYGITCILSFFAHHYTIKTLSNMLGGIKFFKNISLGHFNSAYLPNLSIYWYIFLVIPTMYVEAAKLLLDYHVLLYLFPLAMKFGDTPTILLTLLTSISFVTSDTLSVSDISFCLVLMMMKYDTIKKQQFSKKIVFLVLALTLCVINLITCVGRTTSNPNYYFMTQMLSVFIFIIILNDYINVVK